MDRVAVSARPSLRGSGLPWAWILKFWRWGTNSIATSRMMKAGANRGGSGENAIVRTSQLVDMIIGPVSIMMANAMMGELTPKIATAVSSSAARKILIPLTQERVWIAGVSREPLPHLVNQAVNMVKEMVQEMDQHV